MFPQQIRIMGNSKSKEGGVPSFGAAERRHVVKPLEMSSATLCIVAARHPEIPISLNHYPSAARAPGD
jgi:hypothetical protein